jgi:uncharacterized protein (TIGR03067 family)
MRRQYLLVLVTAMIVGADHPQHEAGKLQGTWAIVSADGLDVPQEALKRMKVVIRGETLCFTDGSEEREKSTFKLDPSQKPKAIDFTKDQKGPIVRGIYELDGDTLKLVWRNEGPRPTEILTKRRPKKFTGEPSEDDNLRMMTLKKEKQQ